MDLVKDLPNLNKRWWIWQRHGRVLLLLLSFLLMPALASSAPSAIRDLPQIIESGVLRVAMLKTDERPFFYHNKAGEFVGIDVELSAMIVNELGVKLELSRTPTTFDGVIEMVATGKVDLGMSYLSITSARAKKVFYTKPYALNYFAVAVNRVAEARAHSRGDTDALLNQPRARIGVQMDSTYEKFARRTFPRATLVSIYNAATNLEAVSRGEIDAAISANLSLLPLLQENPIFNYRLRAEIYQHEPDLMAPAVHPQSLHLLKWMNTFLELQELSGALDTIKASHGILSRKDP